MYIPMYELYHYRILIYFACKIYRYSKCFEFVYLIQCLQTCSTWKQLYNINGIYI